MVTHNQRLWIVNTTASPHSINEMSQVAGIKEWVYLGSNYLILKKFEESMPCMARISLSKDLVDVAWRLRKDFVGWLSEMGRPYGDSLRWWMSDLAEKNTMVSDLFVNICYLYTVENIIRDRSEPPLIVTEDPLLGLTLHDSLTRKGYNSNLLGHRCLWYLYGYGKELLNFSKNIVIDILRLLIYHFLANVTLQKAEDKWPPINKRCVMIHTCVDETCLGNNGTFRDRYFTRLPEWLKSQDYCVVTVIWPYNIRGSLREFFLKFRRAKDNFLIPEDFFPLGAYPRAIITIISQLTLGLGRDFKYFNNKNMALLLWKERIRQASKIGLARFILYDKMIEQLCNRGYRIDYFVDIFENMKIEKPVVKAIKKLSPQTRCIGFQHVPFDPFLLLYYTHDNDMERAADVFPQQIVCCGENFYNIMIDNGFPPSILTVGPSLRYHYLGEDAAEQKETADEGFILILLPLEMDAAVEVFSRASEALQDLNYRIAVRPHPMMNRKKLLSFMDMDNLPSHMEWADGDMKMWLRKSLCILGSATAAMIEAVISGIPIVIIGREAGLDRNPLSWWQSDEPMFKALYTKEELRMAVVGWKNMDDERRKQRTNMARECLSNCFHRWDEGILRQIFP